MLLPNFRLEMAALHPESLLLIFSRENGLIYQKMGTGDWPGAPQATRARLGGGAPWCLVCTSWVPSAVSYYCIFSNIPKLIESIFMEFFGVGLLIVSRTFSFSGF